MYRSRVITLVGPLHESVLLLHTIKDDYMFKVVLSGFRTKEEAKGFLDWFEGAGEQDEMIGGWMGNDDIGIQCDVQTGMIEHSDGYEYKIKVFDE